MSSDIMQEMRDVLHRSASFQLVLKTVAQASCLPLLFRKRHTFRRSFFAQAKACATVRILRQAEPVLPHSDPCRPEAQIRVGERRD